MSLKSDVAREFRAKHPNKPTLALARLMYGKNKELYKDVEDARYCLRRIEGKAGAQQLKQMPDKSMVKPEPRPYNPYKLPESASEPRTPFKLPLACNNVLVISDLHIPYHNIPALTAALNYGLEQKVNTIFINGDLIDFHKLSRFINDPRKRNVKEEIDTTKEVLSIIRNTFPNASIYYLKGNHCIRLEMYMREKAKELYDLDFWQLENLLELNKYKVTILDDKVLVKMGKLSVTHGHHVIRGIFAPVSSARGLYNKAKQSALIGHVHKVSEHTETDMDDNITTCWSTGCLCELRPDYSPLVSGYAHGFAHVSIHKDGTYNVKNFRIKNGKIL